MTATVKTNQPSGKINGWLALSPLLVFIGVYLITSITINDFYKIPISSAFLIASIYSLIIGKGNIEHRISVFSSGAGNKNVLLMIWIFILAGAFSGSAKAIGAIDATVNLTIMILPGKLLFAGLFLASCFISMAIGTSVGTVVALVPIASGIAQEAGFGIPMVTAIIVGGAFFGDNLSFISDTTIAATKTQGCSMSDKFKANISIAAPAAIVVTVIYLILGQSAGNIPSPGPQNWILIMPYILVIVLAISGMNVMTVLTLGMGTNFIIGLISGKIGWAGFLRAVGDGISGMSGLIIVTMLAGGMLEVIRQNGGLDFIIKGLTKRIKGKRGAEFSIAALVSLVNFCTANNTIAIITTGQISKDITTRFGLDPRKTASILDTFSCVIQGIIPYGAQLLMAAGLAKISSASIIAYLYYPLSLAFFACLAIIFRFPGKYS
ncbi:MAG: Na+/H+ antiporter NhaC family protein [Bacteroidales bacterium]|nr:Na+/H+ antiporter NhaC family protein [Bacteroidales bacterium]MCI1786273.1 Na+/H+ antiporter NhaC family protein [Bacteroidales bacterium]